MSATCGRPAEVIHGSCQPELPGNCTIDSLMNTHENTGSRTSRRWQPPGGPSFPTWVWASRVWRWDPCCIATALSALTDCRRQVLPPGWPTCGPKRRASSGSFWWAACPRWSPSIRSRHSISTPARRLMRLRSRSVLDSPYMKKNLRELIPGLHQAHPKIYPDAGRSSAARCKADSISATGGRISAVCIDDVALVRSMWTTDNNHGAQLQFHTGRHALEGQFPTIGSWVHYGLGSLNENLPQFCVIGTPIADCCGGMGAHGANYLGPEHAGIQLDVDPHNPLPFATPGADVYREEQQSEFELLGRLNRLSAVEYPDDPALTARIKSYELAFRMQTAVPRRHQLCGRDGRDAGRCTA